MGVTNHRIKEHDTVHHLVNRIAHKVYFLGEEERNELIEMVRRAVVFCGVRLLGWCIMENHFHLLVYLPQRVEVSDDEVLSRIEVLKGRAGRLRAEAQIAFWRELGDEASVKAWFDRQRAHMYDIGEFMKIVLQWFTVEYNRRHSHIGTLWESSYHDRAVPQRVVDMSHVLGYIHLNPIRAAASDCYDGYKWSSFTALAQGDAMALEGLRFVYDDAQATIEDLMSRHVALLDGLLEDEKRRRAEEIARKRVAGFEVPVDHLTDEAKVAQAAAHIQKVQQAAIDLWQESELRNAMRRERTQRILNAVAANPNVSPGCLAETLDVSRATIYRVLRAYRRQACA